MLRQSIDIARSQRAKAFELRAALGLARLLAARGERKAARATLGPVVEWFTEGLDTADMQAAKKLIGELD